MAGKKVVETVYGKYHKYEIVKSPGGLISTIKFNIYRDGAYHKGSYSSLSDAVAAAKKLG